MPATSDQVAKKMLDVIIESEKMTSAVLKAALADLLKQPDTSRRTRTTLGDLAAKSGRNLESIEINASNIKDFEKAAKRHHVQFALRREVGSDPPVFHVIFQSNRMEDMQRAFADYAGVMQKRVKEHTIPKEKRQEIAKAAQKAHNKSHGKSQERNLTHGEVTR
ncbi:MAG: PcfB family protein [Acutalibacteraceae bacterium]|nr:PcfB family protein [Acutalibacteraceae bacterium]